MSSCRFVPRISKWGFKNAPEKCDAVGNVIMKRYYLINDEMFVDGVFTVMLSLKPPAKRQH